LSAKYNQRAAIIEGLCAGFADWNYSVLRIPEINRTWCYG